MNSNREIKVAELFAGVGGFRLGLKAAGPNYKVVWFNQWEPGKKKQSAWEVYAREFTCFELKHANNTNTDIAKVDVKDIPDFDLLAGGFPCQDYSVARPLNQAKGIVGKKGVLWWQIERIIREKAPSYLMLENVDRLIKSPAKARGRDFAIILASLANLGYIVEWRVINAADYGFPQRRRRIYMMGYHPRTEIYKKILETKPDPFEVLTDGLINGAFPAHRPKSRQESCGFNFIPALDIEEDLIEITNGFSDLYPENPFYNSGIMVKHAIYTCELEPDYNGKRETLGQMLQKEEVPGEFFIGEKDLERWKYLKGPKKEKRKTKAGHVYNYTEGGMAFPDPFDKPSRTIVTGEGGQGPSRFKHVVRQGNRLRRLMPVELERLNGFPPDHTRGLSDSRRAFLMGNALVVGIVERLGRELNRRIQG